MQSSELYDIYKQYPFISTDTRKIVPNSIFFALKGDNFNGNAYADRALEAGAKYVVIDEAQYVKGDHYILVADVLESLQELAKYHREKLHIPVIGVTGTNGKTTTKELLLAVLSQKFKTYATQGNLNNHIGVPLTLLAIDPSYEMAIVEMGANHLHEIRLLCEIAQPTHGLITNVGRAHLEGFGSFEGVKLAKGELYDYLQNTQGVLFLQADNAELVDMAESRTIKDVVRYGFSDSNDLIGKLIHANPYLSIRWKVKGTTPVYEVSTSLTGAYNIENFLAAIAVGKHFDINPININSGIESYTPTNNRSQITNTARNTIIADFYNANASSMNAALENMAVLDMEHKVVILGDMFEMGAESFTEHKRVIVKAKSLNLDRLVFIGEAFFAQKDDDAAFYKCVADAKEDLSSITNSFILVKASRGMAFEELLEIL